MADAPFIIVEALYPGLTQLDFTGPHTIFSRIPGAEVIVASEAGGPIESDDRLTFAGTRRLADIARCDLLFVPGGLASTDVINDLAFMAEFKRLAAGAAAELSGEAFAQTVQLNIEYAPAPPFDSGRPETATAEALAMSRARYAKLLPGRLEGARAAAARLSVA